VYDFGFRLLALHYTTLHILKNDILLNGLASCWNVRLKSVVHHQNFVLTLPSGSSYWRSFLDIVTVLPPPVAFLIRPPTLHLLSPLLSCFVHCPAAFILRRRYCLRNFHELSEKKQVEETSRRVSL
jgi:hypothetical protein